MFELDLVFGVCLTMMKKKLMTLSYGKLYLHLVCLHRLVWELPVTMKVSVHDTGPRWECMLSINLRKEYRLLCLMQVRQVRQVL